MPVHVIHIPKGGTIKIIPHKGPNIYKVHTKYRKQMNSQK